MGKVITENTKISLALFLMLCGGVAYAATKFNTIDNQQAAIEELKADRKKLTEDVGDIKSDIKVIKNALKVKDASTDL